MFTQKQGGYFLGIILGGSGVLLALAISLHSFEMIKNLFIYNFGIFIGLLILYLTKYQGGKK